MKERLLLDPESSRKLAACMLKTFNRMKKRVGFLLYQFVLPALQVSLFCLAIGQDPKELPVAVVNAENAGAACVSADTITECPVSLTGRGNGLARVPRLQELFMQVEVEVVSNSRNKIHQT